MTAPIWMASPPEVHSTLLSAGPGPASLLAAAGSWSSLGASYASIAQELSAVLADVQTGAWQGPSAETLVAAYAPYLDWLLQAGSHSTDLAAQHESAAAAYTSARAAMPTLPELATNHATHGVLLATNFFGLNAIPITLNELAYVAMWIRAAAAMTQYELVAHTAVATTAPPDQAPPQIVKPAHGDDGSDTGGSGSHIVDNDSGNPYQLSWWVNRLVEPVNTLQPDIAEFSQHPLLAISQLEADIPGLVADEAGHAVEAYLAFAPEINAAAFFSTAASPAPISGLTGLIGLADSSPDAVATPTEPAPQTATAPVPTSSPVSHAAPMTAPATPAAPAPTPAPTAAPAAGAPPPPAAGVEGAGYPYLTGPFGVGLSSSSRASARSVAKKKAPEPDSAAAAAPAEGQLALVRRRRRAKLTSYGHEFMQMNIEVDPDWGAPPVATAPSLLASNQGAAPIGFTGATRKAGGAAATGLATLPGAGYGDGPSAPMVPGTWQPDPPEPGDQHEPTDPGS